jgi:signal transduction histidine kinase
LFVDSALDNVRLAAAAMQESVEFDNVIKVAFEQLRLLSFDPACCDVILSGDENNSLDHWVCTGQGEAPVRMPNTADGNPLAVALLDSQETDYTVVSSTKSAAGKTLAFDSTDVASSLAAQMTSARDRLFLHVVRSGRATLQYSDDTDLIPNEQLSVLRKLSTAIGHAFVRCLDLRQVEQQARQARVESALERLRVRTMAMNHSEELADAAGLLYSELSKLGILIISCGYVLIDTATRTGSHYLATPEGSFELKPFQLKHTESDVLLNIYTSWEAREPYCVTVLKGKDNLAHHSMVANKAVNFPWPEKQYLALIPEDAVINTINFSHGYLMVLGLEPYDQQQLELLVRFGKVFDLTYRRFLEIKTAEAQAWDSRVEAALERIRARALAMHKSSELVDVAAVLWEQMSMLAQSPLEACGIFFSDDTVGAGQFWYAIRLPKSRRGSVHKGRVVLRPGTSELADEWFEHVGDDKGDSMIQLGGTKLNAWLNELGWREAGAQDSGNPTQYFYFSNFSGGAVVRVCSNTPSVEDRKLHRRAASVFDLGFRRYVDLTVSEHQARREDLEDALERVRARALAMHSPEEFADVDDVLRHEMAQIGVEALETNVLFIFHSATQQAEGWFANKDATGKRTPAVRLDIRLEDTAIGKQMLSFFMSTQTQISMAMTGKKHVEWIDYLGERSASVAAKVTEKIPGRTYHLFKFSHGAIGAVAPGDIPAETWELLQRASSVITLAYSRFKDLTQARIDWQQLKLEKQRAEEALTELKATQSQLIHAEKMASLGELTAGVAHEIQNPLNFVNNFADLGNELLTEMIAELRKKNYDDAAQIASDVQQNLTKILHHGGRADVIVKGMLQHSRASTGTKEPTNINLLADEYLRIAYHGLRAKDKNFNATLKTDFDESIGELNIIPQDVGRVLLNLFTNAFHAVTERAADENAIDNTSSPYVPTVGVTTRSAGKKIEIRVLDNGKGIPEIIREKIFQPFFTTKPTGQGTGLGLSLSYDLVKAHGGMLTVKTAINEGSEFIITLPKN